MWSERLDASSFASEWLFPHSQPLVRTRLSRQEHSVEITLGWVAAVSTVLSFVYIGAFIPGSRWNVVGRSPLLSDFWRISDNLRPFFSQSEPNGCLRAESVLMLVRSSLFLTAKAEFLKFSSSTWINKCSVEVLHLYRVRVVKHVLK